jgi:hypothetical protein
MKRRKKSSNWKDDVVNQRVVSLKRGRMRDDKEMTLCLQCALTIPKCYRRVIGISDDDCEWCGYNKYDRNEIHPLDLELEKERC